MTGTIIPSNLKLVLEHLGAIRELDRYLRLKDNEGWRDVEKDLELQVKTGLRPALEERLPVLKTWQFEQEESSAYWYPESWKLKNDAVSLYIILPHPLGADLDRDTYDDDPSVNIYVPSSLQSKPVFTKRSAAPKWVHDLLHDGFELASENPQWFKNCPLVSFVNSMEPDGSFDDVKLVGRLAAAAEKVIRHEPEITETICALRSKRVPKKAEKRRKATKPSGA